MAKSSFLKSFLDKNSRFIIAGVALLALFYSFSFLVKEDVFTRFDFDMTVKIQNAIPVRLDPYFSVLSLLGSFEVMLGILIVLFVILRKVRGIFVAGIFCFMHVVEIIGKTFLDHPVTPFIFHRYAFDFFFPTSYVQPGGSYPSGHAMRTAFLAVIFIAIVNRSKLSRNLKLGLFGLLGAVYLIMIVSRVSLGEHWTTDVIGGSMLGTAFAFFSIIFI